MKRRTPKTLNTKRICPECGEAITGNGCVWCEEHSWDNYTYGVNPYQAIIDMRGVNEDDFPIAPNEKRKGRY